MNLSRILVWDLPLRLFHWLLALSFAGAFVTAESERYRDVHVVLGYTVLGLLLFRLLWAFVGSRYARIESFAFGARSVVSYLRSLLAGRTLHFTGHNPAGSWAIYAMMILGMLTSVTGVAVYEEIGFRWLEELHEGAANAMLALVVVHVAGVIVSSLAHRQNLVAAMITGYKAGDPADGIAKTRWIVAVALACAVAVFWTDALDVRALVAVPGEHSASQRSEDADD